MLPQLYLIRHGETEWSLSGQHTGVTDIPLTARWIGLPVTEGQRFQLGTASLSIFGYDPHHHEVPVIVMLNSNSPAGFESGTTRAIDRRENEGSEILDSPRDQTGVVTDSASCPGEADDP